MCWDRTDIPCLGWAPTLPGAGFASALLKHGMSVPCHAAFDKKNSWELDLCTGIEQTYHV